jgi:tetratricopeptide (TPR) repeat protein
VYFRRNDVAAAAQWFDAAIAVDPNRETAYRYAGDALDAAGETDAALDHYLNAVIAEPYSKMPWMGLKQWAQRHHVTLRRPQIPALAAPTTTAKGKAVQITVNADGDPALMAAQIA